MLSARHSGRLSQWMPLALFTALACYRATFVSTQTVSQTRSVAELLDDANLPWAKSSGKRCSVVDRVLMPGAAPGVVGVERSIGTGLGLGECKAFCAASERCSAITHVARSGDCYTYEGVCVEVMAQANSAVYTRPVVFNEWRVAANTYCDGAADKHDVRSELECKSLCLASPPCSAASIYPNDVATDLHSCYTVHSSCSMRVSQYQGAVHFNPTYVPPDGGGQNSPLAEPAWGASVGWQCTASLARSVTSMNATSVTTPLPGTVLNTTMGVMKDECQAQCRTSPTCNAFTYNAFTTECTIVSGACNEEAAPGGVDVVTYYKPWDTSDGSSGCTEGDWSGPKDLTFNECKALCAATGGCSAIAMAPCYLLLGNCTDGGSNPAQLPGGTGNIFKAPQAGNKNTTSDGGVAVDVPDGDATPGGDSTEDAGTLSQDSSSGANTSSSSPLSTLVWVAIGFGIVMMLALCAVFAFMLKDKRRAGYAKQDPKKGTIETRELNLGDEEAALAADGGAGAPRDSAVWGPPAARKEIVAQDEGGAAGGGGDLPEAESFRTLAKNLYAESSQEAKSAPGGGESPLAFAPAGKQPLLTPMSPQQTSPSELVALPVDYAPPRAHSAPSSDMNDSEMDIDDLLPSDDDSPSGSGRLAMPPR